MVALFALFGAGIGGAVVLLAFGLRPPARPTRRASRGMPAKGSMVRVAGVLTVAAVVGAATRWPVAAILAGLAAWSLPAVLGPDRAHRQMLARVEAIAAWAEDLAGTLRSAAGLEQAIVQTAQVAPAQIRAELMALAAAPRAGIKLPDALRQFATSMADPTADLVTNVLLQASQHQARDIAASLAGVGRAARQHAAARLRIATGRARTRTATRIIIAVVLGCAAGLTLFAHDFLAPYGSPAGQLILAVIGAMFAGCLLWLVRTGRVPDLPRILTNLDNPAATQGGDR
ncbi:type II secretion protein F [Phytohabitans rumicis]|uniref:type II secretion system F family protein n=1 Tax=Phytohabitans rumicis TaxID=1076125 RepID=UPI0031EFDF97